MFNKITTLMIVVPITIFVIIFVAFAVGSPYSGETSSHSLKKSDKYNQSQVLLMAQQEHPGLFTTMSGELYKLCSAEYDGDGIWFITSAGTDNYYSWGQWRGIPVSRNYWLLWFNENSNEFSEPWIGTVEELKEHRGDVPSYDNTRFPGDDG